MLNNGICTTLITHNAQMAVVCRQTFAAPRRNSDIRSWCALVLLGAIAIQFGEPYVAWHRPRPADWEPAGQTAPLAHQVIIGLL